MCIARRTDPVHCHILAVATIGSFERVSWTVVYLCVQVPDSLLNYHPHQVS
jgi:hypothetical protein